MKGGMHPLLTHACGLMCTELCACRLPTKMAWRCRGLYTAAQDLQYQVLAKLSHSIIRAFCSCRGASGCALLIT